EGAHVAGALDVVLAAHRVDADAFAADVPAGHGQVGHAHHHGGALAVLGDAEAVVDGAVRRRRVQPGGGAQLFGRVAGDRLDGLWAVLRAGDELGPRVEVLAACRHEVPVDQVLGDHHVGHGVDHGDVGAGPQLEVVGGLDVRGTHQVDGARV